ncbi:TRAP transporter substrate-binding protein [Marispirochaeta aestuarii]|uniref:TRAP transporter substrate-binding protein n=1 Tax=Marispirochaeta aestuarii TaxID=1963862 RepID=UPI0029C8B989|nr:TRAP transporter substrate-binding protein [Marispirochaeta aestuarii]
MVTRAGFRSVTVLLLLLLLFPVFGGGAQESGKLELKIATAINEKTELADAMKEFKRLVEEKSNGEIEVVTYFGAVLGEEKSVLEQLGTNDVQMNVGGSGTISWHAPEYYITGIPFIFEDSDQFEKLTNDLIDNYIRDIVLDRTGVRILGISNRAPRNLVTVNRKIVTPDDVKGLQMRLPTYDSWIKSWEALGATPHPIPAAEQFSALQMGVVEATENPMSTLYNMQLTEPCKYLILTNHLFEARVWSISDKFYQSLSDEHKKIIDESAAAAMQYLTDRNKETDAEYLEKIKEQGLEVVVPDRAKFREKVIPVIDDIRKDWAPGLYEEYVKPLI